VGDADDLRLLSEHLQSSDPNIKEEDDGYWLRYSGFESLTEPTKVYELAIKLLDEIRGVAKLLGGGTLKVEVARLAEENRAGPRPQYGFLKGIPSDERIGMSTEQLVGIVATAERNPGIAKALTYFQRGDWFNLYKAWEAVRDGVGGEKALLDEKRWTDKKTKNRFTQTVNNPNVIGDEARHGVWKDQPPSKPMTIDEAQEFVGRLIRAWVREADA
jgi:hypothetical protein